MSNRHQYKYLSYNNLKIAIILVITRFCIPCYAFGSENLNWSVNSSYEISPDNTLIALTYLVSNLSLLGDANGMTSFTVEGGSNQGVFYAGDTGSFTSQIFDNYTTYTGDVIGAGGNNTFSLLALYLGNPIEGTASAMQGNFIWVTYDQYGKGYYEK